MEKTLIKILLVEDDAGDARLIERILAKSSELAEFAVELVGSLSDAINCLSSRKYDIILLDLALPDSSGIKTVQKVCEATDIPVVVLTGIGNEEMGLSAIRNGASDYLIKDLPLNILLARTIIYTLERNKTIKALAQSEGKFRTLVEHIPKKIFIKDKNSVYLFSNHNYAQDIKIKAEEITGKTDYDFYPKELAEKYHADDKRIIETGKTEDIEEKYIENGEERWVHTIKTPYKDVKGNIIGVLGIFCDITEHKKAEEQIANLAKFPKENSNPVYRVSKDGILLYANSASRRLILEDQTKIGDKIPEKWIGMIKNVYDSGTRQRVEVELNGRTFLFEQVPVIESGYVNSYAIDITERKKAEELILETNRQLQETSQKLLNTKQELEKKNQALEKAREELEYRVMQRTAELVKANRTLQATEEKMHKMIIQNTDGIIIVDRNGIVRFVNPAACSLFNRKPEEFIGEIFGFPVVAGQSAEIDVIHRDGKPVTAEMQVAEIVWEGESVSLISIRDITKRKLAEENLRKANQKLKEYNQLKDDFVSTASHELRTPLSIIMGAIRLTLDEIPGKIVSEQRDILTTAMESVNRLTRIVDSLLTISRIESGKLVSQTATVNICELVKSTVSDYKPLAYEKGLSLNCKVPNRGIDICIDPDKIKEVLINLISNSIKFTPEGGWINIACEKLKEEVRLSVQDSGVGIAKNSMPKLFDKFTQFGRKAGPGEKGTGLGLAIAKKLVEMHNGRIEVESEINQGTTFTISLPLKISEKNDLSAEVDELAETTVTNS